MTRPAYILPLLLAITITGCKQPSSPAPDATADTREALPAQSEQPAAPSGVTMRYSCDQGQRVDIVGGNTAHVTLADGRVVDLQRVPDSAPPRYSGEALSFEVGSDGATLGQDEAGGSACREPD